MASGEVPVTTAFEARQREKAPRLLVLVQALKKSGHIRIPYAVQAIAWTGPSALAWCEGEAWADQGFDAAQFAAAAATLGLRPVFELTRARNIRGVQFAPVVVPSTIKRA
jgi:hypothetical protein